MNTGVDGGDGGDGVDGMPGLAAHIESLVFDERVADARELFVEHETELAQSSKLRRQVAALRGYFAFYDDDFTAAENYLRLALKGSGALGARASFFLAAIAHRRDDEATTRARLADAIRWGGRTFIAEWARAQWADRFPNELAPAPVRSWPSPWRLVAYGLMAAGAMLMAVAAARASVGRVEQRAKLARAEAAVRPGDAKKAEVFFVGGAGWAKQSVFLSEVHAARMASSRRFGEEAHAVVLANDPMADDDEPALTNHGLGHVLAAVGEKMNREDDVLFLYLTSHGSREGLALGLADGTRETLAPSALRAMLDAAGIRWRVVVVQGCESGVFLDALANDDTVVATAAASDRPSYGCADGVAFTDFGRAFIDQRFAGSGSLIQAIERATADVAAQDEREARLASHPSVRVGAHIAQRLEALEASRNPSEQPAAPARRARGTPPR